MYVRTVDVQESWNLVVADWVYQHSRVRRWLDIQILPNVRVVVLRSKIVALGYIQSSGEVRDREVVLTINSASYLQYVSSAVFPSPQPMTVLRPAVTRGTL